MDELINNEELKELLDRLYNKYNRVEFIERDPISIPHSFSNKQDIEISGFLAATIAWGNRKAIVASAQKMMNYMDNAPHDFIINAQESELQRLKKYVYRTFNGDDFLSFCLSLRYIITKYGSLGEFFTNQYLEHKDLREVLRIFREEFLRDTTNTHCHKHIGSIAKGSACKRLNMYLRWMVRCDNRGVDFGLWPEIPMSGLYMPLDVHTSNMGRALGLMERKQNDWRAVEQLTGALGAFCCDDPVRYDFALFGAGVDGFLKM